MPPPVQQQIAVYFIRAHHQIMPFTDRRRLLQLAHVKAAPDRIMRVANEQPGTRVDGSGLKASSKW